MAQSADALVESVREKFEAGSLTKEDFVDAWTQLEALLGDGEEAEGIEALTLYGEPEWIDELIES